MLRASANTTATGMASGKMQKERAWNTELAVSKGRGMHLRHPRLSHSMGRLSREEGRSKQEAGTGWWVVVDGGSRAAKRNFRLPHTIPIALGLCDGLSCPPLQSITPRPRPRPPSMHLQRQTCNQTPMTMGFILRPPATCCQHWDDDEASNSTRHTRSRTVQVHLHVSHWPRSLCLLLPSQRHRNITSPSYSAQPSTLSAL